MGAYRLIARQFRLYSAGQLFAQFHSPLVKGKNIPDHTLDKYLVLVHGDQAAQGLGGEFAKQN